MRAHRLLAPTLGAALALVGCSDASSPPPRATPEPPTSYQPLVEQGDWSEVSRPADPFVTEPSAAPACAGAGFRIEADYDWLEIDTGVCNWVTLSGRARYAVTKGQKLKLSVSHYDLDAAAPAEATLELRFADCTAWSKLIPIPSPAAVDVEELAAPCALRAGDEVLFHLHNHGQNTYQLQGLAVLR